MSADTNEKIKVGTPLDRSDARVRHADSLGGAIRAFYERVVNTPVISTSFPSANTNMGISLRFTLAQ